MNFGRLKIMRKSIAAYSTILQLEDWRLLSGKSVNFGLQKLRFSLSS